jgi:tetratricopeptide (TPR) repeat protein
VCCTWPIKSIRQGESRVEWALRSFDENCLHLAREIGARYTEGTVLSNLGVIDAAHDQIPQAPELYQQRLILACSIGACQAEGIVLWNWSLALFRQGNIEQAIAMAEQVVAILEQMKDARADGVRQQIQPWRASV